MKVSLNWIKILDQYHGNSNAPLKDVPKLIEKIGSQLGAVEETIDLGKKYQGIVIVEVVSCVKHPNADKLSVCLVDDSEKIKNVKRNQDGLVEVVCGAPNVKAGMLAAWIPPGSTVPSTLDKEPFVIEAREIRGVVSNGMLASLKELDLGDDHSGILAVQDAKPGDDFAKTYYLDDHIIDIENKMFTHRPDCFGLWGIAREIAGIYHLPFKSPAWYREDANLPTDGRKNVLKLSIKNDLPDLVPRFCAVAIKDVKVGPSPVWMQTFLIRMGVRPINNIVDVTNWFMLETAQPLHAYDYDKVKTGVLGVRKSKAGEQVKLLNGKTLKLDESAIVITDGKAPIGLGGVMGGADTEVDEGTKNIILECANFDMNTIRRTAMYYGLFTEASTRFTKNQSRRQNRAVIAKAATDLLQMYGGRLASLLVDDIHFKPKDVIVKTSAKLISSRLGLQLSSTQIKKLLENVEFKVKTSADQISVTTPFWRTDIEIPEDIVEEVGRLYGYDQLPQNLPTRDLSPAKVDQRIAAKAKIRQKLTAAGANEVLTYSFVHSSLLQKVGQDPKFAYKIANALSPDLQYYRLSVIPSLLEKVHPNIKLGYDIFALYEIGKVHSKERSKDKDGLPVEDEYTSLVIAASDRTKPTGSAYYHATKYLDYLIGQELGFKPITPQMQTFQVMKPYQAGRSAMVHLKSTGQFLGIVGEFTPAVSNNLKLPAYCAGFELDTAILAEVIASPAVYRPLNKFPLLEQDLTLKLPANISYAQATDFIYRFLEDAGKKHGYIGDIHPLDIYQRPSDKDHKQITWRITLAHPERTLTTKESNKLLDELAAKAKAELNAERV